MKTKQVSLIYIFGPKRLWQDYLQGKPISWVKIGKHDCNDGEDKWTSAVKRINSISHTGIPEPSRLYEVFAYPHQKGNYDDDFRNILTQELYTINNSKTNNRLIDDPFEIKAGKEFVYDVNRDQIRNAKKVYERDLMLKFDKSLLPVLQDMILANQINPFDELEVADTMNKSSKQPGSKRPDPLMEKVYNNLPEYIKSITTPSSGERYRYVLIKSERPGFGYSASYSIRKRLISVAYETFGGEKSRDEIRAYGYASRGLQIEEQQGSKRADKWAWRVTGSLDQPEDQVVAWFVENICEMYSLFENLGRDDTHETQKDLEEIKQRHNAVINKYRNNPAGDLAIFVDKCKSSKNLEERGLNSNDTV